MVLLHLLDPTTAPDALGMLATLIDRVPDAIHHVLVLGHRATARAAVGAGVPETLLRYGHSMGWADPTGWRTVRKAIAELGPTHLHAWGIGGAVAATVQHGFAGPRIATLADPPRPGQLRLLRLLAQRAPWVFVGPSSSIARRLQSAGLDPAGPRSDERLGRVVRIRPGVALKDAASANKAALRRELGVAAGDQPVILLGGENVRAARHVHGLWAAAILQQIFPQTRVLTRAAPPAFAARIAATRDFAVTLPDPEMAIFVSPELPWSTLVQAADIFLITPDAPIATGSVLWAMAAGVPVIGTAIECVSELIEHGHTGLLAASEKNARAHSAPRRIARRLEELMADPALRFPLVDKARADVFAHFKPAHMVACYAAVYAQTLADPQIREGLALPAPEMTAADRFASLIPSA